MILISVPYDAISTLQTAFGELGTQATGAMNGLTELKGQWNEISFGDRAVMTQTLQAAASNIHKFLNAGIVRSLSAKYRPDRYRRDKSVKFGTELP